MGRKTRFMLLLVTTAAALPGCAPDRAAILRADARRTCDNGGLTPNLALGPTAEHGRLAELFTYRSEWPAVWTGYRFDDASYYSLFLHDFQAYYDRFGGFYQDRESFRTGVFLR